MIKYTLPLLLSFLVCSCTSTLPKKLNGTWEMGQVYDNAIEVTDQHNPKAERWITFYKDGSFKSGGAPYDENGGRWTYNEADNVLFLDSDEGEGGLNPWRI